MDVETVQIQAFARPERPGPWQGKRSSARASALQGCVPSHAFDVQTSAQKPCFREPALPRRTVDVLHAVFTRMFHEGLSSHNPQQQPGMSRSRPRPIGKHARVLPARPSRHRSTRTIAIRRVPDGWTGSSLSMNRDSIPYQTRRLDRTDPNDSGLQSGFDDRFERTSSRANPRMTLNTRKEELQGPLVGRKNQHARCGGPLLRPRTGRV